MFMDLWTRRYICIYWWEMHGLLFMLIIMSKCRLLVLLKCLCNKQCGPRPDCSSWRRLIWIHTVCMLKLEIGIIIHIMAAYGSRWHHFQMHYFAAGEGFFYIIRRCIWPKISLFSIFTIHHCSHILITVNLVLVRTVKNNYFSLCTN